MSIIRKNKIKTNYYFSVRMVSLNFILIYDNLELNSESRLEAKKGAVGGFDSSILRLFLKHLSPHSSSLNGPKGSPLNEDTMSRLKEFLQQSSECFSKG